MVWNRETLMAAARTSFPNLKECFIEPMVDLYLSKPEVFKEIVKNDIKRDMKAKKKPVVPTPQSLFESAVSVTAEEKSVVVVEVSNEEASEALVG
jgi:hypothetical protein